MEAILSATNKRSALISEFEARRVQRMLAKLFLRDLRLGEKIEVSGWREGAWVCVRWELSDANRSFVYPVECRVDVKASRLRESEGKDLVHDFLGHFFGLFLTERDQPFTGPKWEDVSFAGHVLWIRGQVHDRRADGDADRILLNAAREEPSEA